MEKTKVSKHEDRVAVSRVIGIEQMEKGPLKELLAATASATELEQTPNKNQRRKTAVATARVGREELLWWE